MNHTRALCWAAALAVGCGPSGGDDDVACEAALLAGDLVIDEIMANPEGEDEGNEWFEIYNATTGAVDLTGLRLTVAKEDATAPKSHVMSQQVIDAGDYLVLGGVLPDLKPAWVDYGFADELGSLYNTAGRVWLACGETAVDEVLYGESASGRSLQLTGSMTPDYLANDILDNWCDAGDDQEYATGNFGTPGQANPACETVNPDSCNDGGTDRPLVAPVVGDLVITEYMPSPDTIADDAGEWFEVLVTRDVDLNGLQLGRAEIATGAGDVETTLTSSDCLRATAGSYVLFARSADSGLNGGLPGTPYLFDFSLVGTDDGLFVGYGGAVLDLVTYAAADDGASTSLDPDHLDPTDNDSAANWCPGRTAYHVDNLGTPGVANQQCIGAGECDDGGVVRAINSPLPADVTITEYLANPLGTDGPFEWVEVRFAAAADLNGVKLERTTTATVTFDSAYCLEVDAGEHVVFADSLDPLANGGLPKADFVFGAFSLNNSDTGFFLQVGATELDRVDYTSSSDGYAAALNLAGDTWLCAAAADVYSVNTPPEQNRGTPGSPNTNTAACP